MKISRFVAACALIAGFAPCLGSLSLADSNTGAVRGIVRLPDGEPACGVHVRILSQYESVWSTQTDNHGTYIFLSLLPGDLTVEFAGIGIESLRTPGALDTLFDLVRFYGGHERTVLQRARVSANLTTEVDVTVQEPPGLGRTAPAGFRAAAERCAPADGRYAFFSDYQSF